MVQHPPRIYLEAISRSLDGTERRTRHGANTEHDILELFKIIECDDGFADRVCTLDVDFNDDTPFSRGVGRRLIAAFPKLQNLESLTLDGCFNHDFGLLATPLHFPHLTTLSCDFPLSTELERFFAINPTITNLYFEGYDMGNLEPLEPVLWKEILPNLEDLRCDILLLSYFAPQRPIQCVFPVNSDGVSFALDLDHALDPLKSSTAIGGVKVFWMELDYPLEWLAKIAPNLEKLHLVEDDKCDTEPRFWNAPGWEHNLGLFNNLQKIKIHTSVALSRGEQCDLIERWGSARHHLLRITFVKWKGPVLQDEVPPLPELVHDGGSPQDSDDEILDDYDDEDEDLEDDDSSCSSDDEEMPASGGKRWDWNDGLGEWIVATR